MLSAPFFRKYILPGLVFQSVVIGGGYATGRELIEFFFASGPVGGVLGLLVSGLIFGLVLAIGFNFARVTNSYDYRHFCQKLLGRGWIIFEGAFFVLMILILSVIASAAGELVSSSLGIPAVVGTVILMALVALLTFSGSETIKKVLALWSFLLYVLYAALFVLAFIYLGSEISETYASAATSEGWFSGGILYSGYNLAVLPAVLFAVKGQASQRESIGSGLIAGLIAVIPAIFFYTAMMGVSPEVATAPVPAILLMQALEIPVLSAVFQIVVFGTFIETGTALLHAVNERIDGALQDQGRQLSKSLRPMIAISILILAIVAGSWFGVVALIAQGYGLLTLVFIGVLVVPLLTVGVWLSFKNTHS